MSAQHAANVPTDLAVASLTHAVTVRVTDPRGAARSLPTFRASDGTLHARYASPLPGEHHWRVEETGQAGTITLMPYDGTNPLYRHGPIEVAPDRRHLQHADGTPFFWLADTWWMGLCHRLTFPEEFARLTADRVAKGFNVVQIVAGLYPDMHAFDPRGANEAGYPWEADYAAIRPEYFEAADQRIAYLVDHGIVPCIVGAWGYFLGWMGVEKLKQHWHELIARYAAYPVVWCVAGEANLPWYLAEGFPYDDREAVHGWTEVARYVKETDPFHRPLTIHPTAIGRYTARHAIDDPTLLDFDMLQTPHGQREAFPVTVKAIRESYAAEPTMPVINGEAAYEMLMDALPTEWTVAMFWACLTNGACGHTYGANGIWQLNRPGQPHGASPHGQGDGYGRITWEEAMALPGSSQVAHGKRLFESLPWTELVPMAGSVAWAEARDGDDPLAGPQACGVYDSLRVAYAPDGRDVLLTDLRVDAAYAVERMDVASGERQALGSVTAGGGSLRLVAPDRKAGWVAVVRLG